MPHNHALRAPRLLLGLSLLLVLSLLLAGCGFKPRGYFAVPEALQDATLVTMSDRPSEIRPMLQRALQVNGVTLRDEAPVILEIHEERHTRRSVSLRGRSSGSQVAEYELRSEVFFSVRERDGNQLLIAPRSIFTERVYAYDGDNITASEAQEVVLRQQIYQDLAQQIVRQYVSLKR